MSSEATDLHFMPEEVPFDEVAPSGPGAALSLLVERAQSGDMAAFDEIMICTQRRVLSLAWRLLGNPDDARDAAQEVFLRTFKYLPRLRTEYDLHGWIYRVTVNVCRDIARRRKLGNSDFVSIDSNNLTDGLETLRATSDAEADAIIAQKRAMITRALSTLTERERAVLVLRDLEGCSTEDVARHMGSRPATVRSQICSARAKIKLYCDRVLKKGGKKKL